MVNGSNSKAWCFFSCFFAINSSTPFPFTIWLLPRPSVTCLESALLFARQVPTVPLTDLSVCTCQWRLTAWWTVYQLTNLVCQRSQRSRLVLTFTLLRCNKEPCDEVQQRCGRCGPQKLEDLSQAPRFRGDLSRLVGHSSESSSPARFETLGSSACSQAALQVSWHRPHWWTLQLLQLHNRTSATAPAPSERPPGTGALQTHRAPLQFCSRGFTRMPSLLGGSSPRIATSVTHFAKEDSETNHSAGGNFASDDQTRLARHHQWAHLHPRNHSAPFWEVRWVLLLRLRPSRWLHHEQAPANAGKHCAWRSWVQGQNIEALLDSASPTARPKQSASQRSEQNALHRVHGGPIHWGPHGPGAQLCLQWLPVRFLRSRPCQNLAPLDKTCWSAWLPEICPYLGMCAAKLTYPRVWSQVNQNHPAAVEGPSMAQLLSRRGGETKDKTLTLVHADYKGFSQDLPTFHMSHQATGSHKHFGHWTNSWWSQRGRHCPMGWVTMTQRAQLPWSKYAAQGPLGNHAKNDTIKIMFRTLPYLTPPTLVVVEWQEDGHRDTTKQQSILKIILDCQKSHAEVS